MDDNPPPRFGKGRANVALLLVLVVLIAALGAWAYRKNPPLSPSPSATSAPQTVPGGTPNEGQPTS